MSNINQELADKYAGIAGEAAKLTAKATAESMKHQFAATKDATVEVYHTAKDKMADAKSSTNNFLHNVGDKIKSTTATVLEKTADIADNLADKARGKAATM